MMRSTASRPRASELSAHPRLGQELGFALLSAMLVVLVIAGVLLDYALRARTDRGIAINTGTLAVARAAARAGEEHALVRFRALQESQSSSAGNPQEFSDRWNDLANGRGDVSQAVLTEGVTYSVKVWDAASRISLNHAPGSELRNLLVALDVAPSEAQAIANSILAWREGAAGPSLGAMSFRSENDQADSASPQRPFYDLNDLRSLPGMSEHHGKVILHLTLHSGGRLNLNTAERPVLDAIDGIRGEAAGVILQHRRSGRAIRNFFELEGALSAEGRAHLQQHAAELIPRIIFEPQIVEISSTGKTEFGAVQSSSHAVAVRSGREVSVVHRTVQ